MNIAFHDRHEAGHRLADLVQAVAWHSDGGVVVLGIPCGGVPVAYEVARALDAPLDVMVVRKLAAIGQSELAAIAPAGVRVLNDSLIARYRLNDAVVAEVERAERSELDRQERIYRQDRPRIALAGRTAVLVDDILFTGTPMRAAAIAARRLGATRVIVAVPVASPIAADGLAEVVDDVICLARPGDVQPVDSYYENFPRLNDDDVQAYLEEAALRPQLNEHFV